MRQFKITCPYCFQEFRDDQVHFRMETYFEDESDIGDSGMDVEKIEQMADTAESRQLKMQIRRGRRFLLKDDEKYNHFWKNYGKTTELRGIADAVNPWQLPILNPDELEDQNVLKLLNHDAKGKEQFLTRDMDGMVKSVTDIYGKETRRRVCPYCHNPLPNLYGKNEVKFISVIGVTSSGKTVYISQLLKHLNRYCAYVKMSASPLSSHETDFLKKNLVVSDMPLPESTPTGVLVQPLFYDLLRTDEKDRMVTNTIVIQDIAGEAFKDSLFLEKYGRFITKSDGIILILDPSQLQLISGQYEGEVMPTLVLDTIHKAFVGDSGKPCTIPVAVCVSKCDKFSDNLDQLKSDIQPITGPDDEYVQVFNSVDYNVLEPEIKRLMNPEVKSRLELQYISFNYFAFSATGCDVEEREIETKDGQPSKKAYFLAGPPNPKRIAEPVFWLFHQFGYMKSEVPIRLPKRRKAPDNGKKQIGWTEPTFLEKLRGVKPEPIWADLTPEEMDAFNYEISIRARRPK